MSEGHSCPNCGSISLDPEWCDVCGADLGLRATSDPWLTLGDTVSFAVEPIPEAPSGPSEPYRSEDTLPPMGPRGPWPPPDDVTGSAPSWPPTLPPGPVLHEATTLEIGVRDTAEHPVTGDAATAVVVTIASVVAEFGHKRVYMAVDGEGREYRLEERPAGAIESVPAAARTLGWLLDLPLGAARHGSHEVRLYRHVPGQTMHERLSARTESLTPSEIVEWMYPVAQAMKAIHDAGFLCLRLCPYTVKYTESGGVFLYGVEVLYPQDAALEKLPAIAGYTAPEVYEASVGEPPGVAADLYMAGMLVYFLVAGADPPASLYSGHTPVILARDHAPAFPLGFAPALASLGAPHPADRPRTADEFMDVVVHARDRAVRHVSAMVDVRVGVAAETHVGIVKRLHTLENQDTVFATADPSGSTALLMVADGVSTATYGSGDRASRIAGDEAAAAWRVWRKSPEVVRERGVARWLDDLLQAMNRGIVEAVNTEYAPFPAEPSEVMGSTCVVAFLRHGMCHLAALGDSRAYLVRDGFVEQITRDHNLMTLGIAQGLDPDTALTFPQGDALARCLGAFEMGEAGRLVPVPVEPDHYVFPLLPGDRLLLCSDGLTDYAGRTPDEVEERIYELVMSDDLPDLVCLDLIRAANAGGGGDNVACAVAFADPTFSDPMEWFASLHADDDMELEPEPDA